MIWKILRALTNNDKGFCNRGMLMETFQRILLILLKGVLHLFYARMYLYFVPYNVGCALPPVLDSIWWKIWFILNFLLVSKSFLKSISKKIGAVIFLYDIKVTLATGFEYYIHVTSQCSNWGIKNNFNYYDYVKSFYSFFIDTEPIKIAFYSSALVCNTIANVDAHFYEASVLETNHSWQMIC